MTTLINRNASKLLNTLRNESMPCSIAEIIERNPELSYQAISNSLDILFEESMSNPWIRKYRSEDSTTKNKYMLTQRGREIAEQINSLQVDK